MVTASGVGSWPGEDVREALSVVRGELVDGLPEGVEGLPYLPELPARGPGADLVGRTAGLLVDLPVDLQPQGWRLVDHPGRDAERTAAWWRQDLDELAEAFDGWSGQLKLQVAGPWTLASQLWLPLGDRVLDDPGATRDLADSLADGVAEHVRAVRRLVPGASPVLQVDEPGLAAVLEGRVRSSSGYRVLPAPDRQQATAALGSVLAAARDAGAVGVALHCCADRPPVAVMRDSGPDALSVDTSLLGPSGWESVAHAVEAGVRLWAGVLSTQPRRAALPAGEAVAPLLQRWAELGLVAADLAAVTVTPACGLAALSPQQAVELTGTTVQVARELAHAASG